MIAVERETLTELIARVEGLTGPDREVDREIGLALCGWEAVDQEGRGFLVIDGSICPDHPGAEYPSFTDSLDSVTALIERELPDWKWERSYDNGSPFMRVVSPGFHAYDFMGVCNSQPSSGWCYGATPALALLAAFLRAKEAEGA